MKIRENILALLPYMTARDEYSGEIGCYLDANENPFESGYNRYPDPRQKAVKERMAELKGVTPNKIFVGNGSDEAIDLILRVFCRPAIDNVVSISPSYGMYRVAAEINDLKVIEVPLDENFDLNADQLLAATNENSAVIVLCSPNNPTGNSLNKSEIEKVLTSFDGIVVIDEAYIDFAKEDGFLSTLDQYPNLIILYTLSKAWGLAALRIGFAFASPTIVEYMNRVKYPYNIGSDTQKIVLKELNSDRMKRELEQMIGERERVVKELMKCSIVKKVWPSDANFILIKVENPQQIYRLLVEKRVIVRERGRQAGGLRVTIGRREENDQLLSILRTL